MTNTTTITPLTITEWKKLYPAFEKMNFFQSCGYWLTRESEGREVLAFSMKEGGKVVSIVQCFIARSKAADFIAIPGGPLFMNGEYDAVLFKAWLDFFHTLAQEKKCSFLRIYPNWGRQFPQPEKTVVAPRYLESFDTIQMDLTLSDDQLLSQMRKTTRQMVKKAIKARDDKELIVQIGNTITQEEYDVYVETTKRNNFFRHQLENLKTEMVTFSQCDKPAFVVTVSDTKQVLSVATCYIVQNTAYLRIAANRLSGMPSPQLVYWECFQHARKLGCHTFDLSGVAPKHSSPKHPWKNVSLYKSGFGGNYIDRMPTIDYPINRIKYAIAWVVDKYRAKKIGF